MKDAECDRRSDDPSPAWQGYRKEGDAESRCGSRRAAAVVVTFRGVPACEEIVAYAQRRFADSFSTEEPTSLRVLIARRRVALQLWCGHRIHTVCDTDPDPLLAVRNGLDELTRLLEPD